MSTEVAADLYRRTYGRAPEVIASAPGRVNIIGEHTDYNGGEVLPIGIALRTWVAMGPATGDSCRAVSREFPRPAAFDHRASRPAGEWWDYVHGPLHIARTIDASQGPVLVAVASDVPSGAGLSSSAALEVATVLARLRLASTTGARSPEEVALLAHRAEREFVGVACGIMDQYASACAVSGHALRIWCDTTRHALVPFDRTVLVVDTAVPRALRDSAFNDRQRHCAQALRRLQEVRPGLMALAHATLEEVELHLRGEEQRLARHVVSESARVGQVVDALAGGASLGPWLAASHASLRDGYRCSSPELDWVAEQAGSIAGIEGARLTGAGWGGCAIVVGEPGALAGFEPVLCGNFRRRWGHLPRTWLTRAHDGARIEDPDSH